MGITRSGARNVKVRFSEGRIGLSHLSGSCKCSAESTVRRAVIGSPGGDFISDRYTQALCHTPSTVAFALHFPISVGVDRAARQMSNGFVARALSALSILSARYSEARWHARHLFIEQLFYSLVNRVTADRSVFRSLSENFF